MFQTGFNPDDPPAGPLLVAVSSHAIEVDGKVLDATGRSVSGVLLTLTFDGPAAAAGSTTGSDGSFQFVPRQPGDYHIYVRDDSRYFDGPDYLKKHEGDFPALKVVDGTNAQVTLRLPGK